MAASSPARPDPGDILLVVHDFQARSSDELSLTKGDRVELIERDDEFGDGWFLGKHMVNGNSGLFPEVYTRPAPKNVPPPTTSTITGVLSSSRTPLSPLSENIEKTPVTSPSKGNSNPNGAPAGTPSSQHTPTPVTLPLNAVKITSSSSGDLGRFNTNQDSHVLHDTLNVINEHITDLNTPQTNGSIRAMNDSGSEYSSHIDHRLSYIKGEETDEEEDETDGPIHTRTEVESWSADDVAEYLFTTGVEKHHCEVFRDQEITGEVLLGMDQATLFIKAFDLGPVGRRLKTWQKIKTLQDEVNGILPLTRRGTGNYSDAGSEATGRVRSRTNTLTGSGSRMQSIGSPSRVLSTSSGKHGALGSPSVGNADSPSRILFHEKRPSAASVRELHHSRRHSSTDFRIPGSELGTPSMTPMLMPSGSFPRAETSHKKQPSFDRNWTLGGATTYAQRPLSSAGFQDVLGGSPSVMLQDSAVDLDRGYFSGPDADAKKRNLLRKRDSVQASDHSRVPSYADEQRVRSGTALSRHSRFGSVDSVQHVGASPAAQKYYGLTSGSRRRTASTTTTDSVRPVPPAKDGTPTVTRLDASPTPKSNNPIKRLSQINHPDFNINIIMKGGFGLRAASDAITGSEKFKAGPPLEPTFNKDSTTIYSPSRTDSSTPSVGPSFELESPDTAKSPSTFATTTSRASKRKGKKETSAYTRGLQKIGPREAIIDADYSGWMKKKSSNLMTTWKPRLFVLKGRRLAYYYSEDDDQEKGLIDISFHRVLPADNERLTGLHATLTGAGTTPTIPADSNIPTLAATDAERDPTKESEQMFIFKLVPPRAGLSRAVTFTKPTVHYFAVPNIKQGRLWMAALMKATIDRDDTQPITTTYQQKTISLAKARQMRHRPPALMNLDEKNDENATGDGQNGEKKENGLGISYEALDSGISGVDKFGLAPRVESATVSSKFSFGGSSDKDAALLPQSA